MSIATMITLISCGIILLVVLYLTIHPSYDSGPARLSAFAAMAIGCVSPIVEVIKGVDYEILPTTAALTSGTAIFMVSHWLAFEIKSRKKREGDYGNESKKRLAT